LHTKLHTKLRLFYKKFSFQWKSWKFFDSLYSDRYHCATSSLGAHARFLHESTKIGTRFSNETACTIFVCTEIPNETLVFLMKNTIKWSLNSDEVIKGHCFTAQQCIFIFYTNISCKLWYMLSHVRVNFCVINLSQ